MKYTKLEIADLILCEPFIHEDNRGIVYESFKKETFNEFLGFEVDFCQDNVSSSKFGVIRGLHTNTLKYAQSKLISVLDGKILDVAVDFRVGSPTYGKYISLELSSENKKQLFVPRGFLHGFSVLSNFALVNIKIDRYFAPGESIGVCYNDKDLDIDWQVTNKDTTLGDGDKSLPAFKEIGSPFKFGENYY